MIAVVHEKNAQEILDRLIAMKENAFFIGEVVERKGAEERIQWVWRQIMKLKTEHTVNKRGVLNIKNPFLKLMTWVERNNFV